MLLKLNHGKKLKMLFDFIFHKLRPLLFAVNSETLHEGMLAFVSVISKIPGLLPFLTRQFKEENPVLQIQLFDVSLKNSIGLAAGFDKDGKILPALFALGFGFVEIGTVTPNPQTGNPRPRLFRLVKDKALINRLGFNSHGAQEMAKLLVSRQKNIIQEDFNFVDTNIDFSSRMLGINIGINKNTSLKKAVDDYIYCLNTLHAFADYFTLNISSPNTEDLRKLQEKDALRVLLDSVCARRDKLDQIHLKKTPLLIKLAPDLNDSTLLKSIGVIQEFSIQGVIATNTTLKRPQLKSKQRNETGGLSGKPLKKRSTEMIRHLYRELGTEMPIIGVGGIFSGADAYEKIRAGASAVQIYTALIYEGPRLVQKIKRELAKLLNDDGFTSISDAVGIDS